MQSAEELRKHAQDCGQQADSARGLRSGDFLLLQFRLSAVLYECTAEIVERMDRGGVIQVEEKLAPTYSECCSLTTETPLVSSFNCPFCDSKMPPLNPSGRCPRCTAEFTTRGNGLYHVYERAAPR